MIRNALGYLALAAVAWWLWTGPVQDMRSVSEEEVLKANAQNMARCMGAREFAATFAAPAERDAQRDCAKKYGLYLDQGQWRELKPPRD